MIWNDRNAKFMRCINSGQDSEQHHNITEGLEVKCTTRHW